MKGKRLHILLVLGVLIMSSSSCDFIKKTNNETVIARVFDTYLYESELADAVPEGTNSHDSAIIAKNFIDKWVRKQLMLTKAEAALSEEQKDFERKIEEYRSSLLIFSYRQKLLLQKMDTIITEAQIQRYYDSNIVNFVLSEEIVKALYVKVPLTAPDINDVRQWSRSATMEDLDQLEKYSINYADKFDIFNNSWIYFSKLLKQIPLNISQPGRYLQYNKNIETTDSLFHYFVHIYEQKQIGETKPIDLISEDIKSILLNKRKLEFYNNLEKQVYNEGVNRHQFEIY